MVILSDAVVAWPPVAASSASSTDLAENAAAGHAASTARGMSKPAAAAALTVPTARIPLERFCV